MQPRQLMATATIIDNNEMTMTLHIARLSLLALLALPIGMAAQEPADTVATQVPDAGQPASPKQTATMPAMTVADDDDIPIDDVAMQNDTVGRSRVNRASGFNAVDYVLSRRYRNYGDTISMRWYDNLFLQAGLGTEKLSTLSDGYSINALTSIRFAVGKNINRLNTLRIGAHADFGFQEGSEVLFGKGGLTVDHLYNLSAYFDGYNPTRLFEVSTLMGIGGQLSRLRRNSGWEMSLEGHFGLQLKFYTGPQSYIALEPYVGISSDKADVSGDRNWRKYDTFYGANLSYIYYLGNNLSRSRRRKLIENRSENDKLRSDSTLASWQKPWFVELAAGPSLDSPSFGLFKSMGHETTVGIGKWLSPVIGVRLSGVVRSAKWKNETVTSPEPSYNAEAERFYYKGYFGVRLDALFNPLGFTKKFSWDSRFGFYLIAGGELGRVLRYNSSNHLNTYAATYSAGAHFFATIDDGVQVFVEPRGLYYVFDIPYYDNRARSQRNTDAAISINLGITVTTAARNTKWRSSVSGAHSRFTVGVGGGTGLLYRRSTMSGAGMNYNVEGWGEWHIDRLSGIRVGFEYMSMATTHSTLYYDYNMAYPDEGYLRTTRQGIWHRRYGLGVLSLNYAFDFTEALSPASPSRRFSVTAFAGPVIMFSMGDKATIDEAERVQQGHVVEVARKPVTGTALGANVGIRLSANITKGIGVYLSPQLVVWRLLTTPGIDYMELKHNETLNIGVQYSF